MRRSNRRGFTIVELVIVIAVVAVLAAVLIPTFASLVKKANNSADTQMVANINKYLAAVSATDGKNENIVDAMKDAEEAGYSAKAIANATNNIFWDSEDDCFVVVEEGKKKIIAGSEDDKLNDGETKNLAARYWLISNEVSTDYALCLVNVVAKSNIDVAYGLYMMATPGTEFTIQVTGANVDIYGVIHTLKAGESNPTVHGYVYILNGSVTSDGGIFHTNDTKDGVKGGNAAVTPQPTIQCYNDGNDSCVFCKSNEQFACTHDGKVTTPITTASCTEKGVDTIRCPACGYTDVTVSDKLAHTVVVDKAVAPTCTETGLTEGKHCSVCKMTLESQNVVPMKDHELEEVAAKTATCTEAGHEAGKKCKHCSYTEGMAEITVEHKWSTTGTIAAGDEATCSKKGWTTYTCEYGCGTTNRVQDVDININAHNWVVTGTTTATCTLEEKTTYVCGHDNTHTKTETTGEKNLNKHTNTTTVNSKTATCTEDGYTGNTYCNDCKQEFTDGTTIPCTGHGTITAGTAELKNVKDATCTEGGYSGDTCCKACGEKIADGTTTTALGHDHQEVANTAREATCTEDGRSADKKCTRCGDTINGSTIPAGHKYGADGSCTVCGNYQVAPEGATVTEISQYVENKSYVTNDESNLQKYYFKLTDNLTITVEQFVAMFGSVQYGSMYTIDDLYFDLNGKTLTILGQKYSGEVEYGSIFVSNDLTFANGTLSILPYPNAGDLADMNPIFTLNNRDKWGADTSMKIQFMKMNVIQYSSFVIETNSADANKAIDSVIITTNSTVTGDASWYGATSGT